MSTGPSLEKAREIAGHIDSLGPITVARFFGGAGLAAQGVQFAFVMGETVYLRTDETTRPEFEALGAVPFEYVGANGIVTVTSYYEVPQTIVAEARELDRWAATAHRIAVARRRKSRSRKASAPAE
jgi:TfoX/Sxy family transcriptional regulator of competence genes